MDRNYKEDQANEVEALDSIYCGEMESKFKERDMAFLPISATFISITYTKMSNILLFDYSIGLWSISQVQNTD